jgi:hypothetical protein
MPLLFFSNAYIDTSVGNLALPKTTQKRQLLLYLVVPGFVRQLKPHKKYTF